MDNIEIPVLYEKHVLGGAFIGRYSYSCFCQALTFLKLQLIIANDSLFSCFGGQIQNTILISNNSKE